MPTLRQRITAVIARRYPFLSGCGTFANSRYLLKAAGAGGGLTWVRLDSGKDLLVPIDDYVGRAAYFVGDLDRKVTEVIRRIVRPGDTVLDIGANLGVVTMSLAALVGDAGQVHSFEPNPRIAKLLMQSLERNLASNVRCHNFALGPETGELFLTFPRHNAGMATLRDKPASDGWEKVPVLVKTLTAVLGEIGVGPVRLVKIDVEGFEEKVLEGADGWLTATPPDAILFESNETGPGKPPDPVITRLTAKGYRLFGLPRSYFFLTLAPLDRCCQEIPASHDFLALKEECCEEILSKFKVQT